MTHRWTRRSLLGLAGLATVTLATRPWAAAAATITVGGLSFSVPDNVISGTPSDGTLGHGWQWAGSTAGTSSPAAMVVLARADLAATGPDEILGLVVAGSVAGQLPGLTLEVAGDRTMPGGGNQTRVDVTYGADPAQRSHGTLLIAVRPGQPAAVLAVIGDDTLSAGRIGTVLDSARWLS